jgi:hypothetical protein
LAGPFDGLRLRFDLGLVFLIEFLLDDGELTSLELGDFDRLPSFGGADERSKYQL